MTGTRLRSRTVTEIRAGSSEMTVEPRHYTTACVLLKQPDKQKPVNYGIATEISGIESFVGPARCDGRL